MKISNKAKHKIGLVLYYIFGIIISLIFIAPLIWMVVSSLKEEPDIFKNLNSLATFFLKLSRLIIMHLFLSEHRCCVLYLTVCFIVLLL